MGMKVKVTGYRARGGLSENNVIVPFTTAPVATGEWDKVTDEMEVDLDTLEQKFVDSNTQVALIEEANAIQQALIFKAQNEAIHVLPAPAKPQLTLLEQLQVLADSLSPAQVNVAMKALRSALGRLA